MNPLAASPVRVVSDAESISYTAAVNASPSELFGILVNPHRHHEVDGSGSVKPHVQGPDRLTAGSVFTTDMHLFGLNYTIRNVATEVIEDRVVEWRHPAGHRWRWEFAPLEDGQTQVTESWIRAKTLPASLIYRALGSAARNDDGIRLSLSRVQEMYAA